MVMVSVDDHVVEPPNLFSGRLPAKYVDLAPKFITNEDGTNAWLYEGQVLPNVALNAVAGRPREEYGLEPTSFDQLRPGCYDIDQRVMDMDANGVVGSLCFPSFPQFCGQLFARTEDKDVALAMVQARLNALAAALADREYLEKHFSGADVLMTTVLRFIRHTTVVADIPVLAAYQARCEARPAFKRALAAQLAPFERYAPVAA